MRNAVDTLIEKVEEFTNPCCVGLDPVLDKIPAEIKEECLGQYGNTRQAVASAFLEFNKVIIDATADVVAVYKPQVAFYERYGPEGMQAFIDTVEYLHKKGKVVIEDAKRNDIGTTASAYADAHLGEVGLLSNKEMVYDVDFLTVNGYLGDDSIRPFVEVCMRSQKGIFVLVKTSNPSSREFQDIQCNGTPNFLRMAELVKRWGRSTEGEHGYSAVGAVVGATFPEEAKLLRKTLPNSYFLVPGYGAQGATARDVIPCFNPDGLGAIVSSSRGIIYAYTAQKPVSRDFGEAAYLAALEMKEEIITALRQ
jgi:orotidine-5'-phosphate decarboxylase